MDLLEGEYEPSPSDWVREQVAAYEASGGREANTLPDHPEWPIVVITSKGAKSGRLRAAPSETKHLAATPVGGDAPIDRARAEAACRHFKRNEISCLALRQE